MKKLLLVLLTLALLTPSGRTWAQRAPKTAGNPPSVRVSPPRSTSARQRARTLVLRGATEITRGDYVKALALFQQAYSLYPSPKILFNMAQTYNELGRRVEALNAYERFLRTAPKQTTQSLREVARQKVQALKAEVATLLIQVVQPGAMIRVDGVEVGLSPMDIPHRVKPGRHLVVVSKKGYITATLKVVLRKGQRLMRPLKLMKPRTRVVIRKEVYRIRHLPRKGLAVLWSGVCTTLAMGVGITVAGVMTKYEESVQNDTSRSVSRRLLAVKRGKTLQWVTEGFIIGAGVAAIFTTIWGLTVVRRSGGTERVPVRETAVTIAPAGAGILLRAVF